jgi:hypothetical protein
MGIHALPVFVSTTVDFASFGRAKLIKWSHSCSHLSFKNQLASHKIDSTPKTALHLVGIAVMPALVKERGVWGRWLNYHGSGSNQICFLDKKRLHKLQGILENSHIRIYPILHLSKAMALGSTSRLANVAQRRAGTSFLMLLKRAFNCTLWPGHGMEKFRLSL